MVHPYSRIDTTAAWEKLRFILLDKSDFHMIDNLPIAVHTFASRMLMSFSVDETLLPRYVNLSTSFRVPPLCGDVSFLIKTHVLRFVCIQVEANAACCLLHAVQRLQDSTFLSEVAVNHLKKARGEIWPKRCERRNNTKTTKMRTKSLQ